jgi:hypothetical protein
MENKKLITIICNGIGMAMGIAVVVLNILGEVEPNNAISMLGIGLFSIGLSMFVNKEENKK